MGPALRAGVRVPAGGAVTKHSVEDLRYWLVRQRPDPDPVAVTITRDRYGGSYSKGKWVAWPLDPEQVPDDADADDSTAYNFWYRAWQEQWRIGLGNTPDEALADLRRRMA